VRPYVGEPDRVGSCSIAPELPVLPGSGPIARHCSSLIPSVTELRELLVRPGHAERGVPGVEHPAAPTVTIVCRTSPTDRAR
jgi:hypothetical protein